MFAPRSALAFIAGVFFCSLQSLAAQQPGDPRASPAPGKPITAAQGTEIRTGNPAKDLNGKSQAGEGVYGTSPSGSTTPPANAGKVKHPCNIGTVTSPASLKDCQASPH